MRLKDQNILFFTRTMELGGTENVVLQLCEIFKPQVNKIVVCSCGGINVEKLKNLGIKHYTLPDITEKTVHNLLTIPRMLATIVEKEQISVVHTHHRMAAFYCQLLRQRRKLTLINTSHTAFYDKKLLTNISFRGFNLISCGADVKKSMSEGLGIDPSRITVIRNGVAKEDYVSNEVEEIRSAHNKGKLVFGAIGRLSKIKGLDYLIQALSMVETSEYLCVIVGDGPEKEHIEKMIADHGLNKKVIMLGYRNDVYNILAQVDFIVQASLIEGLPLVPIEAFSMGKTVIGTDIDGTAEVITDNKNGILVPPADAKALAQALDYMFRTDRAPLEKAAAETYESKFSLEVFAENYIRYYEQLN